MEEANPGKCGSSQKQLDVNEEYSRALHTNSYIDMYSRVHHHDHHIPEYFITPGLFEQATNKSNSIKTLLLDFFDTTLKSSAACFSLLSSIDRARSHHRSIHHLLLSLSSPSTFSQLSSYLDLDNPFSPQSLSHFHHVHSLYPTLIRRLTSAHRKIAHRIKLIRVAKKAYGVAVIALLGAAMVVGAVIASHGAVAVVAAPMVAAGSTTGINGWYSCMSSRRLERVRARVDAAARGAYIVGRDLDTMSQMVRRVRDEVEHGRDVGRMVVRNREWGMVKEVVRVMEGNHEVGLGFEEQLEELEEHVYLCLISINRSRRLVLHEMVMEEEEEEQAREARSCEFFS